jgi:hypothetical protein
MPNWNDDGEGLLELIRQNSVLLSQYHASRYYHFKGYLKYFKLPLIVLSSLTSIASMGLTTYMRQDDISLLTCLLSLGSAIIASIEMYLGINRQMEDELFVSKSFQILSYDIFKTLKLQRDHRSEDGIQYLNEKYNSYIKLVENANLVKNKKLKDQLATIPDEIKLPPTPSSERFGMASEDIKDLEALISKDK